LVVFKGKKLIESRLVFVFQGLDRNFFSGRFWFLGYCFLDIGCFVYQSTSNTKIERCAMLHNCRFAKLFYTVFTQIKNHRSQKHQNFDS